jgi:hypothetical protein
LIPLGLGHHVVEAEVKIGENNKLVFGVGEVTRKKWGRRGLYFIEY